MAELLPTLYYRAGAIVSGLAAATFFGHGVAMHHIEQDAVSQHRYIAAEQYDDTANRDFCITALLGSGALLMAGFGPVTRRFSADSHPDIPPSE